MFSKAGQLLNNKLFSRWWWHWPNSRGQATGVILFQGDFSFHALPTGNPQLQNFSHEARKVTVGLWRFQWMYCPATTFLAVVSFVSANVNQNKNNGQTCRDTHTHREREIERKKLIQRERERELSKKKIIYAITFCYNTKVMHGFCSEK